MINLVVISGRLGSKPELRVTSTSKAISIFSIAYNPGKDRKTEWINCKAWEQNAKYICEYANKGSMIEIVGHISNEEYLTISNGEEKKVERTFVIVDKLSVYNTQKNTLIDKDNKDTDIEVSVDNESADNNFVTIDDMPEFNI